MFLFFLQICDFHFGFSTLLFQTTSLVLILFFCWAGSDRLPLGLTRGYLNMVFVSVRINYIALSLIPTCKSCSSRLYNLVYDSSQVHHHNLSAYPSKGERKGMYMISSNPAQTCLLSTS